MVAALCQKFIFEHDGNAVGESLTITLSPTNLKLYCKQRRWKPSRITCIVVCVHDDLTLVVYCCGSMTNNSSPFFTCSPALTCTAFTTPSHGDDTLVTYSIKQQNTQGYTRLSFVTMFYHLHGTQPGQFLSFLDFIAHFHFHFNHGARHWRTNRAKIIRCLLFCWLSLFCQFFRKKKITNFGSFGCTARFLICFTFISNI